MAASFATTKGATIAPTDLAKVYFADRGVIGSSTVWTEELWTLKNSLTFDQTQGAKTEVNVDQTTTAIAVKYAASTTGFTFRVPDMSKDMFDLFYTGVARTGTGEIGSAVSGETLNDTFLGYGYSMALKTIADKMVMLLYTNGWGIVFPHCEMVPALKKSGEDAWTLDITGTVLAGDAGGEACDVMILVPGTPTP